MIQIILLALLINPDLVCWITVTPDFQSKYEFYRKDVNVLRTAVDTNGNIVVSCNALNEFPELFDTMEVNIIWLSPQAFPQQEEVDK